LGFPNPTWGCLVAWCLLAVSKEEKIKKSYLARKI
jgi:hypothetical protein